MAKNHFIKTINQLLVCLVAFTILLSTTEAAFNSHGVNLDVVTIYGVSTSIKELNYQPKGSLAGGTNVYITCVGQDMVSTQNSVKIGPYDCIIPEKGVTENTVSCVTTEAHDLTRLSNLPVELFVYGKQQSICKGNCKFSYTTDTTPFLKFISPNAAVPNQDINWNGIYRVSSTIDLKKFITKNDKSGQFNCNRFQIREIDSEPLNLNDDEEISAKSQIYVPCTVSQEQIAGLYDVTIENKWGTPIEFSTLTQYTRDGSQSYQFALTPEITKVSQNIAGSKGTVLTIEGSGFGYTAEDIQVSAGGLDCQVLSVNLNNITCEVSEGTTESVDPEQHGQFIKGQGATVTYYEYDSSASTADLLFEAIRNGSLELKEGQEQKQISTWELSELSEWTAAKIEGYFYAPRTGAYNFWNSGDDTVAVYISQTPQNQDLTTEDLITYRSQYSSARLYLSPNDSGFRSEDIQLTEGNYYWLEAYVINRKFGGHFTLSVETPEIPNLEGPISQVPNIKEYSIEPERDNQIWSIKVWNFDDPFGIKFYYKDQDSQKVLWDEKTDEKTWQEWDAESFKNEISNATGQFGPVVEEFLLDSQGNRCQNCEESSAAGKEFTVEFTSYRTPAEKNADPQFSVNIPNSKKSIEKIQEQYGKVSGHYTLQVNGEPLEVIHNKEWTINIPYSADRFKIQEALVRLTDQQSIEVNTSGSADNGYKFLITFRSDNNDEFLENVDFEFENFLEGEKPGSSVEIVQKNVVNASRRVFHEPVPFDLSFQPSDLPAVQVTVNNIQSVVAQGVDNSYQAMEQNTPVITSYSLNGQNLSLSLDQQYENLEISYGFSECGQFNGSSCELQSAIEAGDHQPIVLVKGVGYAEIDSNFTPSEEEVQVQISSISPSGGSIYGGIQATISGSGFSSVAERTSVKFGEVQAQILSISTSEIKVLVPEAQGDYSSAQTVTVTVNGVVNTEENFLYSESGIPTISEISPNKASPVQKGTVQITGTNFGSDEDLIEVHLLNSEGKVAYNLFLQSVQDTQIQATLSGGSVGLYYLKVFHKETGYSLQSEEFSYKIEIHDVQPRNGSLLGGTVITISGQNFSNTDVDNNVFITQGDEKYNEVCSILSATETEIRCITPPKNVNFDENEPVMIFVQGRLIEESVCEGTCTFNYSESHTPVLEEWEQQQQGEDEEVQLYPKVKGDELITILGSNLPQGNSATLQVSYDITIDGSVISETEIQFQLENVPGGVYGALVNISNLGYAGVYTMEVALEIEDTNDFNYGLYGDFLTITGTGFNLNSNSYIESDKQDCIIVSSSFNEVVIITPQASKYGNNYVQINLDNENSTQRFGIRYKHSLTCSLENSSSSFAGGAASVTAQISNQTGFNEDNTVTPYLMNKNDNSRIYTGNYDSNSGEINFQNLNNSNVPTGNYLLFVSVEGLGFAKFDELESSYFEIEITMQNLSIQNVVETGLIGGKVLEITGNGFDAENPSNNQVHVCGFSCEPQENNNNNYSQYSCEVPRVNTKYMQESLGFQKYPSNNFKWILQGQQQQENYDYGATYGTFIADNPTEENLYNLQSDDKSLYYEASEQNSCYFGYDFGEYVRVQIEEVIISLEINQIQGSEPLLGSKVQVSNDGNNWTDIFEMNETNQQSTTRGLVQEETYHRYVRFYNESQDQEEETASCQIAKFQLLGYSFYREQIVDNSDFSCDVTVNVNGVEHVLQNKVNYQGSATSTVENITPYYGWQLGGTEVTITGENFGNNQNAVSVHFDGIECDITSVSNTEIVCTTGNKGASNYANSKVSVSVNGINAIVPEGLFFYYGLLWSEDASWGLEAAPRAGDAVFVQKGRTLIIDQSSPKYIDTIINEGRIIFADKDIDFHVRYFINTRSELIIGTEFNTFTSNLTITLYGGLYDKMLPQYGTKVIACHMCTLDIHGLQKTPTWSFIETTVNPGDSTLTTQAETNWQIGDRIVIATTDFDGRHSEEVFITAITHNENGDSITFQPELEYTHIAVTEQYGDKTLKMIAEVGNLSRNILIQGNPEDNDLELFGGHVMMHGEGSIGRIENTEFTRTGQPRIIGRYTMHFHMVGDSRRSYIRGNAVHNAYARLVALHDIRNLEVFENVSYWVRGHNIFLENGIEVDNRISYNLVVSPRSAFNMLQTDITVAGIWATHPTNYVTYNHVAGSQFYGLWFEIFERPETPNAANDICPEGEPIREIDHNVAHSNERFGLRIFRLSPRTFPCRNIRSDTLEDPWSLNPSVESIYTNHTLYKNGEAGLLAEEMGNTKFQDFILADNYHAGFQAHKTNFTKEEVIFENSVIIGQTQYTIDLGLEDQYMQGSAAIISPRTNGCRVRNVEIYNQLEGSYIVAVASQNDFQPLQVQGGKQFNIENIQLINSNNAYKMKWIGFRNNLVFDVDGSLSETGVPTYITPHHPHLDQAVNDGNCLYTDEIIEDYQDSVICTGTKLRAIPIGNLQKYEYFFLQTIKVLNMNDQEKFSRFNTTEEVPEDFGMHTQDKILVGDGLYDFPIVYATDYAYNVHWNSRLDWSHLQIYPSMHAEDSDKTVILRFNYTEKRELFDIFQRQGYQLTDRYEQLFAKNKFYDADGKPNNSEDGCTLGQYFLDEENSTMSICINNKNRSPSRFQAIDVNGVYCRHTCPVIGFECEKEAGSYRMFSSQEQWLESEGNLALRKRPEEEEYSFGVPQSGDDVVIPCAWTMVFDVAEFTFGTLIIDGTLLIDEGIPHTQITANNIWIRSGKLSGGSEEFPIKSKITITLTGNRYSPPIVIDDVSRTGTKSLAVTGRLELYGTYPEMTQTRLTATVLAGQNQIHVENETDSWNIGDELALGGAALDGTGFEKVKIAGINGKTITLEEPLEFYHYGAQKSTIGNDYQTSYVQIDEKFGGRGLDMRTAVGHLTRNIRIVGTEEDETGGHLQVYHWYRQETSETEIIDIDLRGSIGLGGVELEYMGQVSSDNAGIHILETNTEGEVSSLKNSSVHDCFGICVNMLNAHHTIVSNNVIYRGQQYLIQNLNYNYTEITNNLLIGAYNNVYSSTKYPETFINMYTDYDPSVDVVLVENNVGQSSYSLGFNFPGTPCEQRDNIRFRNNESGKTKDSGIVYRFNKSGLCAGHNQIFHSNEGLSVNTVGTGDVGFEIEQEIIIECQTGIHLRSSSGNSRMHYNTLRDTYISAMVLGEVCPECYNQYNNDYFQCSGLDAAKLLVTNHVGATSPLDKGAMNIKVICNPPVISSSMFIIGCEFANYREDYSTDSMFNQIDANVCKENRVFRTNSNGSEATAAHFLKQTACTNCEKNGMFYLAEPKAGERGWFGGCGLMDCTGMENVMVQDMTGDFFGFLGTAISNNEDVGYGLFENTSEMQDSCDFVPAWNGFLCKRDDFLQLQWEGIGPDFKLVSTAPVYVTNDYFQNVVNMWKEWEWLGPEPQNRRQNSFVALVLDHQRHNITYSGQQPMDMIHKLSERNPTGEQDRYVIVEYRYFNPLTIEVLVNQQQIESFSFKYPEDLGQHTTVCGANNYYYHNSTVHFVVTNVPTCQVQVRQVNFVQINLRIGMTQEDFLDEDDSETTFVNRIIGFLNISFDRVRIVGIVENGRRMLNEENQVELEVILKDDQTPGTEETQYQPANSYTNLKGMADDLKEGIQNDEIEQVLDMDYKVYVVKKAGTAENDDDFFNESDLTEYQNQQKNNEVKEESGDSKTLAIALGVIFGILGLIVIALITYHFYSKRALKQVAQCQQLPQELQQAKEQDPATIKSSENLFEQK